MNAIELLLPDHRPSGIFQCSTCGKVASNRKAAEAHCVCIHCHKPMTLADQKWASNPCHEACYRAECQRRDREREEKAEKLESWDGWVFSDGGGGNNGYFESVDDYMEYCMDDGDNRPDFVWAAKEIPFPKLESGRIFEDLAEKMNYDDAGDNFNGTQELAEAIDRFNAANVSNTLLDWDMRKMVRLDWEAFDKVWPSEPSEAKP